MKREHERLEHDLYDAKLELQDAITAYNVWWTEKLFWLGIRDAARGIPPGAVILNPYVAFQVTRLKFIALFAPYMIEQADLHLAECEHAIYSTEAAIKEFTKERDAKWQEYSQRYWELKEKKERLKVVEDQLAEMDRERMFPALGREG